MASYAVPSDIETLGISREALARIDLDSKQRAIQSASDEIDMFLRPKFTLPLLAWGDDIRQMCVDIAVWRLMKSRGYNPESGADQPIRMAYDDALAKLKLIAQGLLTPEVTDSAPGSAPGKPSDNARVVSAISRGWFNSDPSGPFENG